MSAAASGVPAVPPALVSARALVAALDRLADVLDVPADERAAW